jgi:hypothetical protein
VGPFFDLAVVILALVVVGSLALLAWTLGVSSVRAVRQGRNDVAAARRTVAAAEGRFARQIRRPIQTDDHTER